MSEGQLGRHPIYTAANGKKVRIKSCSRNKLEQRLKAQKDIKDKKNA